MTQRDDIRYLMQKKVNQNLSTIWYDLDTGIERLRQGKFAYNSEESLIYAKVTYFDPSQICDLKELVLQPEHRIGFIVRKDSPYLEVLKVQ